MLFKLGSIKINVKFDGTVLNPPSFLKSAFEIHLLPPVLAVFMPWEKGGESA